MTKHLRKLAFAAVAMLLCFGNDAQAQKKLGLQQIEAMIEGDYSYYNYNKDGLMDSTYSYTTFSDEQIYRLFEYNADGKIIKDEGYCILPPEISSNIGFSKSYEIRYEYDKKGRKISRKNYNLDVFGGTSDFILGGVFVYEYDSEGRLTGHKMYWDEECKKLYETCVMEYNDKGQLVKKTVNQDNFGVETLTSVSNYFYDEQGRILRVRNDGIDPDTGEMGEMDNVAYTYDENNNLVSRVLYTTDPNKPVERRSAVYNLDVLAKDAALPLTLEDDMDFYTLSQNIVVEDSVYRRNAEDVTVFELYDVNEYTYVELDAAGIDNVSYNNDVVAVKRDNEGNVILNGVASFENIRIYDAEGRMVRNSLYDGKIDVSALPSGMYIVSTKRGSVKFSK